MKLPVLLAASLLTITTAYAGPLEDALGVYAAGDHAKAAALLRPLAEQGDVSAQSYLGFMYKSGQGVVEDDAEAVKWYRAAAERGYPLAQYSLASLYEKGEGVSRDYVEAHRWYALAAARFPVSDQDHLQKALKGREKVAALMTPAQLAQAETAARDWTPRP